MTIKLFKLSLILLFCFSCSIEQIIDDQPTQIKLRPPVVCSNLGSFEFFGDSRFLAEQFKQKTQLYSYPANRLVALWILSNIYSRPDVINENSVIQIYKLSNKEKILYSNFKTKQNLSSFLAQFAGTSVHNLVTTVENILPKQLILNKWYELYLQQHKEEVIKNKYYEKKFVIASKTLTEGERFSKIPLKSLLSKTKSKTSPIKETRIQFDKLECNPSEADTNANSIKLNQASKTAFLGARVHGISYFISISLIPSDKIFVGTAPKTVPLVCHFSNSALDAIFLVKNTYEPIQLMNNLQTLNLENSESGKDITYYINYPRFLKVHQKMIIESFRMNENFRDKFLSLRIPIYHKNQIGIIHSYFQEHKNKNSGFIFDQRQPSQIKCPQ